jgi:uncharacterized protein
MSEAVEAFKSCLLGVPVARLYNHALPVLPARESNRTTLMNTTAQFVNMVVGGSFALGLVFGYFANRANFCTMGAVSDIVNMGDYSRMRMWVLAIAVAILGTQVLAVTAQIDLTKSFYLRPQVTWLSHILGGALFGFGMVLASGCGSKTLVRIGGGNLKSLVVFVVMGVFAYMTLRGIFAVARIASVDKVAFEVAGGQGVGQILAKLLGSGAPVVAIGVAVVIALALIVWVFANAEFRMQKESWVGGAIIGAVIAATWYVSGKLGFGENPETLETVYFATNSRTLESFSFVAPAAYTLELFMLWSDKSLKVTLGIAATFGVVIGSAIYALTSRSFRWEGFGSVEDTANHLVGAALMGVGGVTALGCTVGQGITGLSTLAIGSFITFAAIVGGAVAALHYQIWRLSKME